MAGVREELVRAEAVRDAVAVELDGWTVEVERHIMYAVVARRGPAKVEVAVHDDFYAVYGQVQASREGVTVTLTLPTPSVPGGGRFANSVPAMRWQVRKAAEAAVGAVGAAERALAELVGGAA